MGRLAKIAEDTYRLWLPRTYAALTDWAAFFRDLEDEARRQIEALEDSLAGPDVPGETSMDKLGGCAWHGSWPRKP